MGRKFPDGGLGSPVTRKVVRPEGLASVEMRDADSGCAVMGVVDLDPASSTYGQLVRRLAFSAGDGRHHSGWRINCACVCPAMGSSDDRGDTWSIEAEALPTNGGSQAGTVSLDPGLLFSDGQTDALHVSSSRSRAHRQRLDLGTAQQRVLALRSANKPTERYGFASVMTPTDLSGAVWLWYRDDSSGRWKTRKVIEIAAQPAVVDRLPELLKGFAAVPPLVTCLTLSPNDRFLYVSCWGTGELHQYDVCDPFNPVLTGLVNLGGIVTRTEHPRHAGCSSTGGPQAVAVSGDGRRLYVTNSLSPSWDDRFYPDGVRGWIAKIDTRSNGGMSLDANFLCDTGVLRPHRIGLEPVVSS